MGGVVRADVQRNHQRILDAASTCFSREGVEVPMARIAEVAGVGTATLFRHFPAKRELAEAVLMHCLGQSETAVATAVADPDPCRGLRAVLEHFVQSLIRDRRLRRAVGEGRLTEPDIVARHHAVLEDVATLLRHCQVSGGVHPDIELDDLLILTEGIAYAAGSDRWPRALHLAYRAVFRADTDGTA